MTQDDRTPDDEMPDDETLAAWLDGALDAQGARGMTELAARHDALARRAERMRHIDDLVRLAVPAEEAVPDAFLERLGLAPTAAATVVSLAEARAANALIRFAPGIAAPEAGRIARSAGIRLVGQPNAAGAWKAVVEPGRRAASLDALRADTRVIMAEPIDGRAP